jgi:hypothetical protein
MIIPNAEVDRENPYEADNPHWGDSARCSGMLVWEW